MKNKIIDIDLEFEGLEFDEKKIQKLTAGKKASDTMKGKTLEELLGSKERAEQGREARRQSNYRQDYTERSAKTAATRRANGSYGTSMLGKEHKESTKCIMSIKAGIRQELKRRLGLGKSDKVPEELLLKEYKRQGLI